MLSVGIPIGMVVVSNGLTVRVCRNFWIPSWRAKENVYVDVIRNRREYVYVICIVLVMLRVLVTETLVKVVMP